MKRTFLTEEAVEIEIARLTASEAVKLAKEEQRIKYRRRQYLYSLRVLEKRGKELQACGITLDNIESMMECEGDET